eukprot:SAG11_NODE_4051_length_2086_cov_1.212884_1_plen_139_part_00
MNISAPQAEPHKLGFQDFLDPWTIKELGGWLEDAERALSHHERDAAARRATALRQRQNAARLAAEAKARAEAEGRRREAEAVCRRKRAEAEAAAEKAAADERVRQNLEQRARRAAAHKAAIAERQEAVDAACVERLRR